jgi:hypothetical protein
LLRCRRSSSPLLLLLLLPLLLLHLLLLLLLLLSGLVVVVVWCWVWGLGGARRESEREVGVDGWRCLQRPLASPAPVLSGACARARKPASQ